jgi:hypothetical protein
MNKFLLVLLSVMTLSLIGCTAQPAAKMAEPESSAQMADSSVLPEIAPYDDAAIPAIDAPAEE